MTPIMLLGNYYAFSFRHELRFSLDYDFPHYPDPLFTPY